MWLCGKVHRSPLEAMDPMLEPMLELEPPTKCWLYACFVCSVSLVHMYMFVFFYSYSYHLMCEAQPKNPGDFVWDGVDFP
jgi:hypothetical protein